MKILNTISPVFLQLIASILSFYFLSCKSDDGELLYDNNLTPVILNGYNVSNDNLTVKFDTKTLGNIDPNAKFAVRRLFTFDNLSDVSKLTILNQKNNEIILEKIIPNKEPKITYNFFYLDGKFQDIPQKSDITPGKIKLKYLFRPLLTNTNKPLDIVFGKFYFTSKKFVELKRYSNLKPYELSEDITLDTLGNFEVYNGIRQIVQLKAYLYHAGTSEFYTKENGFNWPPATTIPVPSINVVSSKLYIFSEKPTGENISFNKNLEL